MWNKCTLKQSTEVVGRPHMGITLWRYISRSKVIAYCYATALAVSATAGSSSHLEAFT